jgi:hypothetical protein
MVTLIASTASFTGRLFILKGGVKGCIHVFKICEEIKIRLIFSHLRQTSRLP